MRVSASRLSPRVGCSTLLAIIVLLLPGRASTDPGLPPQALPPPELVAGLLATLEMTAPVTQTQSVSTEEWHWTQIQYADETFPLTIDIVVSRFQRPSKVLYLFPGGGVTFQTDFFTPGERNLAHFFRQHDYLIVGITPPGEQCSGLRSRSHGELGLG